MCWRDDRYRRHIRGPRADLPRATQRFDRRESDANDAPELEAIGENERRVDSIRVRAGRYVAAPPTADEVELLEQPRKPKKPGKKKKVAAPR